ncbi:MAG: acetyl-CoA decarbonylase/synthase complex subunit delta [Methanobacteriota archaeon]|nr:MAG: acetyl-CoA decarbonylase/synthase complex subunit delta [Euryarchaeota archaeon]
MGFEMPTEKYSGRIKEVAIGATKDQGGTRTARLIAGGSNGLPFLPFESEMPHPPLVAMDVVDTVRMVPEQLQESMGAAVKDPVEWAKKCEGEWGADLCVLKLQSANPEEEDRPAEELEALVQKTLQSTGIPMVVYGCGFEEKDAKVMEKVSNAAKGERLFLGLAEEKAYKSIAAASMANGHGIVAFSNLDINLAKQMNILLLDFGMKPENILMDPLMAPLGMGLEYSYSNIERLRLGALSGDPVLQMPMICDCSCAWTVPEALEENPERGDPELRGVYWEAMTALAAAVAGADVVIMRHPRSVTTFRNSIKALAGGA